MNKSTYTHINICPTFAFIMNQTIGISYINTNISSKYDHTYPRDEFSTCAIFMRVSHLNIFIC